MNIEKAVVHYISSNQTHVARKKEVLSFKYKDYDFHILNEEKNDSPFILHKDNNGEYWKFYYNYISYERYETTINKTYKEYDKEMYVNYCDYMLDEIKGKYDNLINNFKDRIAENKFFNVVELEFLRTQYPELYPDAVKSREKFLEDRIQKAKEEQKQKEETQNKTIEEKNKGMLDKVWSMKTAIHEGKLVLAESYEYYKENDYNKKTIQNNFLYLFKEYNIDVPLATQGFINNKLHSYNFGNGTLQSWGKYNGTTLFQSLSKLKNEVSKELEKTKEKFELEIEM